MSSDDAASQAASEPLGERAKLYKYAFVSYASKDREEIRFVGLAPIGRRSFAAAAVRHSGLAC